MTYNKIAYDTADGNTSYDSDGWEFVAYLTGNDDDTAHEYYELPNRDFNRWCLQSYFTDPPSPDGDNAWEIHNESSDFYLSCVPNGGDANGEDPDIRLVSEEPDASDSNSGWDFSVTLGYGFGPVTAGASVSLNPGNIDTDHGNDHKYSQWVNHHNDLPTSQDENRGVYLDVYVSTSESSEEFEVDMGHGWDYFGPYDYGTGSGIVHVSTPSVVLNPSVSVVEV